MPGRTAPSIQPTLNVNTKGSLRTIFDPSTGAEEEELGREYAAEAIRYDWEEVVLAVSGSWDMWKSAFIFVWRCRCDNCNVPWSATVKGVQSPFSAVVPPALGREDAIPRSS